ATPHSYSLSLHDALPISLPLTFFSALLTISLTWLHAADKAISIPVQITHAQNFDPFPSPDGKKLVFISMLSGKEQLFIMDVDGRSEEHTSELQSRSDLVC